MKKTVLCVASAMLLATTIGLTACGENYVDVPYDSQISENSQFNENLLYRNTSGISAPDPFVLKITDEESEDFGAYYMYATNNLTVYKSTDLCNWENVSKKVGFSAYALGANDFGQRIGGSFWAPEVVYDGEAKKYYLYFSMEPRYGDTDAEDGTIMCAVSDSPYGPFTAVKEGIPNSTSHETENYFFDMERMSKELRKKYPERFGDDYTYVSAIDPHPWTDPDKNKKYLYFASERYGTYDLTSSVFVMEMEDWTTPKYDTVTMLTKACYTTVEGTRYCDSEIANNKVNEGPCMYARRQQDGTYRYYLTLSVNGATQKSYSVVQAIGTSPTGPFTKLQETEGGVLLGSDRLQWDHISGPGHHTLVEENGNLYVLYHLRLGELTGYGRRDIAMNEVKFALNAEGQEVMYANGPTYESLQLLPEFASEYKNIAGEATITASNGRDASMLTDGLISLYSYIDFVKEFRTTKKVTLTLTFKDWREITGIMIYNSKDYIESFDKISDVKIYFKDGEKTYTGRLKDIPFDWGTHKSSMSDTMRPGGASIALFHPVSVNKIVITIDVPDREIDQDEEGYYIYQEAVALSEIKVIGK